ncbi:PIN domain-containing protein [Leptospira stimsonii]|uniref:EVE domain-containing protein n=1 Tax=Leptospira stimsonii TaxID=2202203 RepID=A0ABY2MWI5_9LEPT|nr:PIN domain-containing protein [Leptospira stimsonii]TGK17595.1 hypothetical protein EHO98_13970 [Leptospira stimsonii]TGM10295.1 hypothetical protein EHQ90_19120 [Leptospira stimsonii]
MKILVDTNILIHREANRPIHGEIGVLFKWVDNLGYTKWIHPTSVDEISKYQNKETLEAFKIKLKNYNLIPVSSPLSKEVEKISNEMDRSDNDHIDSILLNEVYVENVDYLITEDKRIHSKADKLNISNKVFYIESFIEKVTAENPSLKDYKVLAVKREYFNSIDLSDPFFDSFRLDYLEFNSWFRKKGTETAYICRQDGRISAFLYLKIEKIDDSYSDISPAFLPKRRLKIGTLKVELNGLKIGERFLKIVFDNALSMKADEIYVTIFDRTPEQKRLISLFLEFGFIVWGKKVSSNGEELVLVRNFIISKVFPDPKLAYPFISSTARKFIVPIYPDYHTSLLPDSILSTESPLNFVENEPYRNAIRKVYISRSYERNLLAGDIIIFYRTGGKYAGVVTTIGIVENVITDIPNVQQFISLCRRRSVFSDEDLKKHWDYMPTFRPFIVNFLYTYSFPKRPNLQRLIELNVIADINSVPRGFFKISDKNFADIIKETGTDESIIVNQA